MGSKGTPCFQRLLQIAFMSYLSTRAHPPICRLLALLFRTIVFQAFTLHSQRAVDVDKFSPGVFQNRDFRSPCPWQGHFLSVLPVFGPYSPARPWSMGCGVMVFW